MNYTYDDFVMESAMVETTNETAVSDIAMEQYIAEFNVASAAFDAFNKYALIAEYASCDVDEFFQESKNGPDFTTRLTGKIADVGQWKNSGGKMKKILGSIAEAVLRFVRMLSRGLKKLFGKASSPVKKLVSWAKAKKAGKKLTPEQEAKKQAKEDKKNAKEAAKQMKDSDYLAQGEQKRADAYASRVSELDKQNAKQALQIISLKNQWKKKNAEIEKLNEVIRKLTNDLKNANQYIDDWKSHSAKLSHDLADARKDRDEATMSFHKAVQALKELENGGEPEPVQMDAVTGELEDAEKIMALCAELTAKNEVLMKDLYDKLDEAPAESQAAIKEAFAVDMKSNQGVAKLAADCGLRINEQGQVDF